MSKIDNVFQSEAVGKVQRFAQKFSSNNVVQALLNGMMNSLGLIIAGSVFAIIATVLSLTHVISSTGKIYTWLYLPYNMTLGIIGMVMAFTIAYEYAKYKGMKPIPSGVTSLIMFLIVAAPLQNITLDSGETMSVLSGGYLGTSGMFCAMLIAIISTEITSICEKHNIVIKLPDVVPESLTGSFASLIPMVINIVLWHGLNQGLQLLTSMNLPTAILSALAYPMAGLNSLPGMFIIVLVIMILWSFGIHGSATLWPVIFPVMMTYYDQNAQLVADGKAAVFAPILLIEVFYCCGGDGNLLPFTVMALRSKSQRLKTVGKAGIVPMVFNISEPVIFGTPLMYNPILFIPYIFAPLVSMFVCYIGFVIGFFKPTYIMLQASLPVPFGIFAESMAWQNLLIPVVCFIVTFVIYYPFWKVYDGMLVKEEKEQEEETKGEEK